MRYIDALFMSVSASTQSGLNTVDMNNMKLYQQIAWYLMFCCSTPVVISTTVVLIRLLWFERALRDAYPRFKEQSRMRRQETVMSMRAALATVPSQGRVDTAESRQRANAAIHGQNEKEQSHSHESPSSTGNYTDAPTAKREITFGDLPHPNQNKAARTPPNEYSGADTLRSLRLAQKLQQGSREDDDGPPFVVKSLHETEHGPSGGSSDTAAGSATDCSRRGGDDEDEEPAKNYARRVMSHDPAAMSSHDDGAPAAPLKPGGRSLSLDFDKRGRVRNPHGPPADVDMDTGSSTGIQPLTRRSRTFFRRNPDAMSTNYLSWQPTVGRNSTFVGLTPEQREELGGVEYMALKLLAKILVGYNFFMHAAAALFMGTWAGVSWFNGYCETQGFSGVWWGLFAGASGYTNTGLALTGDSFSQLSQSAYPQIVTMFFMIAGNTGFPVLLRFIIWIMFKLTPISSRMHESLGFLLDHPRRCFMLLFPSGATWWLFAILIAMNVVDVVMFLALDVNNPGFSQLHGGYKFLCGLFQAIALRTTGFQVFSIAPTHPAVRITYVIMMYVSAYPVAISIRRTNVYEEQSLGIFYNEQGERDGEKVDDGQGRTHHVASHLRRQLGYDLWYVALFLIIICIGEGSRIQSNDIPFFDVFFEAISAYGTVGASMGYGDTAQSLSGQFNVVSKLCIMALMIRGRHRGLPYKVDRSILLKHDVISRYDSRQELRTRNIHRLTTAVPIPEAAPLLSKEDSHDAV